MVKTFGEVIEKAREILNDKYPEAYRWKDPQLLRFAYDGITYLNKIRPESRYSGVELVVLNIPKIEDEINNVELMQLKDAPVPLDERWIAVITHFIAGTALGLDDSDTLNASRAATQMALVQTMAET